MELLHGNRVDLLVNGSSFFPALLAEIEVARTEIRLETYIFESDQTGCQVVAALIRAARRGVVVRVMVDGFGASGFLPNFGAQLQAAGVKVRVFRPEVARFRMRRHRLRRLHRKLACIDRRVAFVGGINIVDDLPVEGYAAPRHDYAVRIEGPLLAPIHAAMQSLWRLLAWADLRRRIHWRRDEVQGAQNAVAHRVPPVGDVSAAFLVRDNWRHRNDIENAYLAALATAQREVLIANAYFLPGRRFRHALMDAAARGVKVTLLLQGRVEYALLHYATQALYGALLDAGIQIHEYQRSFLHAKVAVVDGLWATVGSSNIDPFSLLLAREANVFVQNAGFASQLAQSLQQAIQHDAVEVRSEAWRRKFWLRRVVNWLAYSTFRLLLDWSGYRDKH